MCVRAPSFGPEYSSAWFAFGGAIPHAPRVREALKQVIDDVLNPLLQSDSSSIELLDVSEDEVTVRVTGRAAFGVGAEFVRTGVIEPALRKVVGDQCTIHIKKTIPTAKRRA